MRKKWSFIVEPPVSVNEETRAVAQSSNIEKCANAGAKLNHVNICCENGTPKSTFVFHVSI
jgi:hypothetical protein